MECVSRKQRPTGLGPHGTTLEAKRLRFRANYVRTTPTITTIVLYAVEEKIDPHRRPSPSAIAASERAA